MSHSLETKVQVVILMAKYESPVMVIRELRRRGTTNIPERRTVTSIYQKFLETGSVGDRAHTGRPSTITEDKAQEIQQILDDEPMNSVRTVAREANISKYQTHQIMRDIIGYKPYMMHSVQQLYDDDMDICVEMSEHLILILEDQRNDGNIFFPDESTFYVSGVVNKHNCRIWTPTNPFITIESAMKSPKVNVWCAMSNKQIIGPYFFEDETANRQNYLQMLKNYFFPIMQRKRLHNKMIFQQDGAPPHFSKEVRAWLNDKFNGRWIGRDDPISWAPRSPDLTPLDFFLWGYIKPKVYKTKVNDIAELKERIEQEIKGIKKETLENVFDGVVKRLRSM
ncbi:unnamed protein product [Didymodactylos carnosus]|uniref:Transposase n=1 Tax=Didymodactylos carnosus TaxID=1234261 RepID=A0A814ZCE2_9BILA|nr:unnamed protein product [Didymodactylos carnosus]CAF4002877.1 unnamed protein product [Didymodactylos carnosus]